MSLRLRRRRMRSTYPRRQPFLAGETVTRGTFRCRRCGYAHEVEAGVVNLPVCPRCQHDRWDPA